MDNSRYNKKIFALLLEVAKGERSWRQFAFDCDISYVQMRKLAQQTQENPPRPKLIRKIADHAFNDLDLEDFMFAAGMMKSEGSFLVKDGGTGDGFYAKYRALSVKNKAFVNDFLDFMLAKDKSKE